MSKSIRLSLKKQSKLTKRYYANLTDYNKEILLHQVSERTKLIVEAKDKHLAKLSSKLDISAYSLLSVKFLKDLYLIPFSIILYKTSSSLRVSLASFQAIHVLLNSCKLRMKSTNVLIAIGHTI